MSEPAATDPPGDDDAECVWCARVMTVGVTILAAVAAVALANILTGGRTWAMLTGRQAAGVPEEGGEDDEA